ncbi:unnamed protein product [Cyclocybe aegerita]|uniref:Carbohydrate-binding module family 19 domain-containing protein n=1 Tax=Cyclocybe aegerita TaxID=1973307 RepID=A0A8S0WCP1_CYCAE|nr:unnamed protein product [Cyclocybe aegerita]
MVQLSTFFQLAGLVAFSVHTPYVDAAPLLYKRIAQTIAASTAQWEQACLAAGGGQQCNPLSIKAFSTLLANAGPCEQQDAADEMVDLANQLNSAEMVRLSQIFVQQPRNTPNSVAIPYCQQAPRNSELDGLFQCQFAGANQQTFAGGATLGAPGTIPFGLNALDPLGSCPSKPDGPVPDGQQLIDIVGNAAPPSQPAPESTQAPDPAPAPAPTESCTTTITSTVTVAAPAPTAETETGAGNNGNGGGGFLLANGQEAQQLNAKFASLNANSACTDGENACVGTAFAQCVGGKFALTNCAATLTCAALPLVNKAGTSITCTTSADAEARIAATGATGGLTGNGASAPPAQDESSGSSPAPAPAPAPAPSTGSDSGSSNSGSTGGSGFLLQNGRDAQQLNAQFSSLTPSSACTAGENACVNGSFAQCVNGSFVLTSCGAGGGLTCAALPLVNKAGTSITCTTRADAEARIAATGATGGFAG